MVVEHENNFLSFECTKRRLEALGIEGIRTIPYLNPLLVLFTVSESSFDFQRYVEVLGVIYSKYIQQVFTHLGSANLIPNKFSLRSERMQIC